MNINFKLEFKDNKGNKENIYYAKSKNNVIIKQKKYNKENKYINFDEMLKIMKDRLKNDSTRLDIIERLKYTKLDSNNIIKNENLYMSIKTINKNELNNMLSTNSNLADDYIKLLKMDVDEYFQRCKKYLKNKLYFKLLEYENSKIGIYKLPSFKKTLEDKNKKYTKEINSHISYKKNKIDQLIEKTKDKTIKYSDIKNNIKSELKNFKFPNIYFDLFRTRKGIRDLRLNKLEHININFMKTNKNINIKNELTNNLNKNSSTLFNNLNLSTIINVLGINKLKKFSNNTNGNKTNGNNTNRNSSRNKNSLTNGNSSKNNTTGNNINGNSLTNQEGINIITEDILNIMINVSNPIDDIISPLYTQKINYLKTKISYNILLYFNSKNVDKIFPTKKEIGRGYNGIVYKSNDDILKYEHLRFRQKLNQNSNSNSISYKFNNYIVFTSFIQSLIQNYLYDLNNAYVPEIISYSISYENDKCLTIMKEAFDSNNKKKSFNGTFWKFITDQSLNKTNNTNNTYSKIYIDNILLIIIEICTILEFYQKKSYFVHSDFHAKNIMLECNFNEDNKIKDLSVKIIDFQFSSIIINYNGTLKIFKDVGFDSFKIIEQVNPHVSSLWNKIDIMYLVVIILFDLISLNKNDRNINYKILYYTLLKIFKFSPDFYENFKNYLRDEENIKEEEILLKKKKLFRKYIKLFKNKQFEKIFGYENFNKNNKNKKKELYSKFIPIVLKKELQNLNKNFNTNFNTNFNKNKNIPTL